jgi:CBS domain-containing protein
MTAMAARSDEPVRGVDWNELLSINGSVSVRRAAIEMINNGVAALIVVRGDGSPALITERDITRSVADRLDPDCVCAADLAQPALVTADADDTLETVGRRLLREGVRHMPVIRDDEIVTVLSVRDVLGALLGTIPASRHDQRREER